MFPACLQLIISKQCFRSVALNIVHPYYCPNPALVYKLMQVELLNSQLGLGLGFMKAVH